jgi:hypothetical protein
MKLYTYKELEEMGLTPDYEPRVKEDWYFLKDGDKIAALFAVRLKKE